MKYTFYVLPLLFLCIGCGDDSQFPCADHAAVGVWVNHQTNDVLGLLSTCEGSSYACNSKFTWSEIDTRHVLIVVSETTSATGCPGVGNHSCEFAVLSNSLTFDCGKGVFVYAKAD